MFHSERNLKKHFTSSIHSFISLENTNTLLEPTFVSGAKIRKTYDVSSSSLRLWAEQGKIQVVRSQEGKGKRLYCLGDFQKLIRRFP